MKGKVSVEGINSIKRPGKKAGVHVDMATGNAACTNARPASAGFNTLNPNPPNSALPNPIATKPAMKPIQSGNPGGNVNANNKPVIAALKSLNVLVLFVSVLNKRSVNKHDSKTTIIKARALIPKR